MIHPRRVEALEWHSPERPCGGAYSIRSLAMEKSRYTLAFNDDYTG